MNLSRSPRTASTLFALALAASLAGCGGRDDDSDSEASVGSTQQTPEATATPTPTASATEEAEDLASCYAGEGESDGTKLYATLRLVRGTGTAVTGTYLVGDTTTGGLPYTVSGSLKDGKLDSVFTAAGQGLNVTGTVDADKIKLDNPEGKFGVTAFEAGCD